MAGHSKFKNIQHRKNAQDAKKARFFARLSREIIVAIQQGGNKPENNFRLRSALNAARAANMPKHNLERLLSKPEKTHYQDVTYEGYGNEGIAIIAEATTDNKNRTASQLRLALSRNGGQLGQRGSVSHLFQRKGFVCYPVLNAGKDTMLEKAMHANTLEDYHNQPEQLVFLCITDHVSDLADELEALLKEKPQDAGVMWLPITCITPKDPASIKHLIDECHTLDDIKNVTTNAVLTSL